jgi:hypothetical protein
VRFPIESDRETAKQIGASLASTYQTALPYPHIRLDDFIEPETLEAVIEDLKNARAPEASSHDRDQERNKLSYHPDTLPADTRSLFRTLNSLPFLSFLEGLTGIRGLIPDPTFLGGASTRCVTAAT